MNCARAQSGRGHNLRFCVFGNAPIMGSAIARKMRLFPAGTRNFAVNGELQASVSFPKGWAYLANSLLNLC